MRGFIECFDGCFYYFVVVDKVLEVWVECVEYCEVKDNEKVWK